MSDTLIEGLRLVSVLNAMTGSGLDAPRAEHLLRVADDGEPGRAHHVFDPAGVLGLEPERGTPVRIALGRVANTLPGERWSLLLPEPGRLAGLRGPAETNSAALETGVIVVAHSGGLGWLPRPIGPAMQWQLVAAERPLLPPTPSEATRALNEQILDAAKELAGLDSPAGTRPEDAASLSLGRSYSPVNQKLLDRAMLWREASRAGRAASPQLLHSHGVMVRDEQLRLLDDICRQAISAAASWPATSQG